MIESTTIETIKKIEELAKPLQEYLEKNFCPHDRIEIEINGVKFLSGLCFMPNKNIKD